MASAIATAICDELSTSASSVADVSLGVNTFLLLFGGALVFLMHGGFAMLEAGAIRSKNAMNILLQTILDAAAAAIMWYCVGFGFAYGIGDKPNKFIGNAMFGLARYKSHYTGSGMGMWTDFFFQWAFCATAATIPAGSVAERFNFNAYMGYSIFIAGFVYPVVAHWAWCVEGWLGFGVNTPLFKAGYIDFAGSGVIHMTGGLAGLIGATMVGPRLGRFDADGNPVEMPGHSAILVVLGTVLLWFGWYGFNPTSMLMITSTPAATVVGRAAVTTTLSGAAGGIACLLNGFRRHRGWDLVGLCNGILCGFVAITACCHVVEPWAAILCGLVAGLWFDFLCWVLLKLKIDDPLSAGPMHFGTGMWGVFFTGLLAKQEYIKEAYTFRSDDVDAYHLYGAFYPHSSGKLLASQVIGLLAIIGWVCGTMIPFFFIFKLAGALRIPPEMEEMGLDRSKHGGSAYNGTGVSPSAPGNDVMRNQPSAKVLPLNG
ncbi:hypothetical protein VOLCADRAFT_77636 [Volvox carteri f. nagariensis]|uniref:Ammonium transporter n=1 Tax=Volvox carteri f. nagariensis TaxID=3068 RepID=D8UG26_VOLCA|nr:uncharacterized protein VOLCADRAFT_77636 [Volvox carteri f. nagariensis]EFJ41277.1 hypothetical protein VOLCADRAFT_77636 [Volvox carteri f. nagariensis]|eukprot:XP_002957611.1 hypothetical protein VOLCADRAFT_77636 [Volvox carteri f. nagariensis]